MDSQLLKAQDVAIILKCSRGQAYSLLARGEIVSIRFGKLLRCTTEALMRFIEEHASDHKVKENSLPSAVTVSKEKSGKSPRFKE